MASLLTVFKKWTVTNPVQAEPIQNLQNNLNDCFRSIYNKEIVDGRLLSDVALSGSALNTITHKLGRPLKGWLITRRDGAADIWDHQSSNNNPELFLILESTLDVTVSLWVF